MAADAEQGGAAMAQVLRALATGVVATMSLLAAGVGWAQAQQAAPAPAVTVVKVEQREITPAVTFTGRIEAKDKVDLRARVEGFLDKRLFEEGQDVKAGDLLFVIEKAPYQAEIENVDAAIARAQATLDSGRARPAPSVGAGQEAGDGAGPARRCNGQGRRGARRPAPAAGEPDHGRAQSRLHRHQGPHRGPDRPREFLGRQLRWARPAVRWRRSSARTRCT